ncbi:MAG: phenylalanine--tRNA ligase subunit beta [bacterium]|nr:phenylalanine--tRNA ligase subunit beta [bacterium]
MPTISVLKEDLERLAGQTYDLPELERALETAKAEVKVEDDTHLRIQLKDTNRPDLWCSEGLARHLKGYRNGRHESYPFFTEKNPENRELHVDPNLESIRPYVAAFACEGIHIDEAALEQLIEAQEKLADGYGRGRSTVAIGIYDASDIVFPVRYEAVDPNETSFVPLEFHAEMTLHQILHEHPTGKIYAHLLDGKDRFPLLRDSRGEVLSMPPVINSQTLGRVEVGDSFLFCEATGTELDAVLLTIAIMAVNMADRGGRILPVTVTYPYDTPRGRTLQCPVDMTTPLEVNLDQIHNIVGGDLDPERIVSALECMGYHNLAMKKDRVRAQPAPYRDDILHPVDLIEDVIVAVGYEAFEPEMPRDFTIGKSAPQEDLSDRFRALMVGCGFQELFLPILTSREDLASRMRNPDAEIVEIANPMSEYYSAVRNSLLPGLLRVESGSRRAPYPHHIFEVGEVAVPAPDELHGTRTEIRLAALEAHAEASLSGIQSHLEALAYYLKVDYTLTPVEHPSFLPGRAGEIRKDGQVFGLIGEIHPEVLETWGVTVPTSAFELNINIAQKAEPAS